jgi:hypothetical protein
VHSSLLHVAKRLSVVRFFVSPRLEEERFSGIDAGKRSASSHGETGAHRPDRLLERAAAVWGTAGGRGLFAQTAGLADLASL